MYNHHTCHTNKDTYLVMLGPWEIMFEPFKTISVSR